MKANIVVEVSEEFLAQRVTELNEEFPDEPPLSVRDLFEQRLKEMSEDELRLALYSWPVKITVEIVE